MIAAHVSPSLARSCLTIEHSSLPMAAVQFHPEAVMTSPDIGLQLIENALRFLAPGAANK